MHTLFKGSPKRKYKKNQLIFYEGDALNSFCYISKGYVKAYSILDSGEQRTIYMLGPKDVFPIAVSLTQQLKTYHLKYFYESLSDVSLAMMPLDQFITLLEDFKNHTTFLAYLAASNVAMIEQLDIMKSKNAINKVAHFLSVLVRRYGKPINKDTSRLGIKLTHQELADLAGLTRETASQQIKHLEDLGVIDQSGRLWKINLTKLNRLSLS